jgi:rare lipoprotein A
MTAAHQNLPFGTYLKVTNTNNGKQVIFRVNDRGPFTVARIIDVSQSAAEQFDMAITGIAVVLKSQPCTCGH